jgi:adenylate kinase
MKVFIANIDTAFGHNLSIILSQTIIGSRKGESEEAEEDKAPEDGAAAKSKPPKTSYIITGSFVADIAADSLNGISYHPAKPGKMIETGDKKKDGNRREAISKIPVKKTKNQWVSQTVNVCFFRV